MSTRSASVKTSGRSSLKALDHDVLIVPVLLDGASMPTPEELPDDVAAVAYRNAAPLRKDPDFHIDAERLIDGIRGAFSTVTATGPAGADRELASSAPPPTRFDRPQAKPGGANRPPPTMSLSNRIALGLFVLLGGLFVVSSWLGFGYSRLVALILVIAAIWFIVIRLRR